MKDGFYWIDPNLGMSDDAVKVYCSMSNGKIVVVKGKFPIFRILLESVDYNLVQNLK